MSKQLTKVEILKAFREKKAEKWNKKKAKRNKA
jgi:hypothetical protein